MVLLVALDGSAEGLDYFMNAFGCGLYDRGYRLFSGFSAVSKNAQQSLLYFKKCV